jgi:hypothetical protein
VIRVVGMQPDPAVARRVVAGDRIPQGAQRPPDGREQALAREGRARRAAVHRHGHDLPRTVAGGEELRRGEGRGRHRRHRQAGHVEGRGEHGARTGNGQHAGHRRTGTRPAGTRPAGTRVCHASQAPRLCDEVTELCGHSTILNVAAQVNQC